MVGSRCKASLPAQMLAHVTAFFIIVSGTVDCLQCYWCGPLAEQVHRSQRAPSCQDGVTNVTTCDPGYTHCAVVASSPPMVESRYCVKFYQDECYTLYCDSTKTHRTTCPCRGELCNGPNTQREVDAFSALANKLAKTDNRIKKRNAISNGIFKTHGQRYLIENDHDEAANLIDNETKNETTNDTVEQPADGNENVNTTSNVSETHTTEASSEPRGSETSASETHAAEPNASELHDNELPKNEEPVEITKPVDIPPEEVNEMKTTQQMSEAVQTELTTTTGPTEVSMKPTESMKAGERIDIEPSQLPTAEALQQGGNSMTDKPTEQVSQTVTTTGATSTTHLNTLKDDKNMTPKPTKSSKNSSFMLSFSGLVLPTCVALIKLTH